MDTPDVQPLTYLHLLALVAPVYAVIAIGFVIRRSGWLTAEADSSLLRVVVNVLVPCLIVDSIVGNPAMQGAGNLLWPPLIGFATVVGGYLLSLATARALRWRPPAKTRTFAFTVGLYNYGYIPIPLVLGLFDDKTLGVLFTHNVGVEIALWTAGITLLTGSATWRHVVNGPVIAVFAAMLLNAGGAHTWTPDFVRSMVHMLAVSAVPLALLLTGATFADWLPSARFGGGAGGVALAGSILRLGVLPLLFLLGARYLPLSIELKRIMVIQAAMPTAVMPVVVAKHYGGDVAVALQVVFATSALALLTIPCWIRFGLHFAGIS